jgi:hypothetical protein
LSRENECRQRSVELGYSRNRSIELTIVEGKRVHDKGVWSWATAKISSEETSANFSAHEFRIKARQQT